MGRFFDRGPVARDEVHTTMGFFSKSVGAHQHAADEWPKFHSLVSMFKRTERLSVDESLVRLPVRFVRVFSVRLVPCGFLTVWGWQPTIVRDARDVSTLLCTYLGSLDREHVVVVMVGMGGQLLGIHTACIGQPTRVAAHPPEIFKPAILACAAAVFVAHNHPMTAGDDPVVPSDDDVEYTKRIVAAGTTLGIPVLDHVIIGRNGAAWISLKALGLM
jgi:DNA repair protein RadC